MAEEPQTCRAVRRNGLTEARRLCGAAEVESVVRLFEQVAEQEGWQPGDQLRAHLPHSVMFALSSPDGRIVGGLQLVRADAEKRLPCQTVWPEIAVPNPEATAHVGVLAMASEWRGRDGGMFWLLAAQMWRYCVLEGIREIRLEATPRTMRCYERIGWPLNVVGELREHWGEPCYPCVLSIRDVGGALSERAVRSASYRQIVSDMIGAELRA